jgi:hypothetical protein
MENLKMKNSDKSKVSENPQHENLPNNMRGNEPQACKEIEIDLEEWERLEKEEEEEFEREFEDAFSEEAIERFLREERLSGFPSRVSFEGNLKPRKNHISDYF